MFHRERGQASGKEDIHLLVFWEVVHEGLGDEGQASNKEGLAHICVGAGQRRLGVLFRTHVSVCGFRIGLVSYLVYHFSMGSF